MKRLLLPMLAMMLVSNGLADPAPRAQELVRLFHHAYPRGRLGIGEPDSLIINLTLRSVVEGEASSVLSSIAIDFESNRFLNRTCVDGLFRYIAGYSSGDIDRWLHELRFSAAGRVADGMLMQAIEYVLNGPNLLSAQPTAYDGFVDYEVVAGEQVKFERSHARSAATDRELRAIFSPVGMLLGELTSGPDGLMLAVLDGLVQVDGRSMPMGWTFYDLSSGRAVRLATLRIWRASFDGTLADSDFRVETPPVASHGARDQLEGRIDDLLLRLSTAAPEAGEALITELLEAFEDRRALRSLEAPACPGPL